MPLFRRRDKPRRTRQDEESNHLRERLVTTLEPNSAGSEAYRSLRTNLIYAVVDKPPKVIVLTSPAPREGKTTVCANLGVVLAQANKRTIILDCDFRKPTVHKIFGIRNIFGVTDVVVGERSLPEVSQEIMAGLEVAPVGPLPPNPAELLSSQRFSELLVGLRREFDYVLVDAPPVEAVSDPLILASQGDGVFLVFDAQKTRKAAVQRSMRSLEDVGANVLGTVMNNVKKTKGGGYYYGSYGPYGSAYR